MHWDTLELLGRERQAALLAEAEDVHRLYGSRSPLRRRLVGWMRALADRLDPAPPPPCRKKPA